jgi:ethanolamine permease
MLSYIMLRVRMPNIERPYKSPTGMWGAVFTGILSIVTLVSLYVTNADYQKGAIAAAIWFALGLVYFAVYGRKRLILSPEEEFAMSQGAARAAAPAASPEATRP